MEPFAGAVTGDATGVILALEVTPSRGKAGFSGYDPWRRSLRFAVQSPPTQGKANRELVEVLARALAIPSTSVQILSGATQSRKRVKIEGMARETAIMLIGRILREKE